MLYTVNSEDIFWCVPAEEDCLKWIKFDVSLLRWENIFSIFLLPSDRGKLKLSKKYLKIIKLSVDPQNFFNCYMMEIFKKCGKNHTEKLDEYHMSIP